MKSLVQSIVIAAALTAPVAVFAQSNAPVTRAQVNAQLVQFQQAGGLRSAGDDPYYPNDAQMTQARADSQNGAAEAVGGVHVGTSSAGAPAATDGPRSLSRSLYLGE